MPVLSSTVATDWYAGSISGESSLGSSADGSPSPEPLVYEEYLEQVPRPEQMLRRVQTLVALAGVPAGNAYTSIPAL